MAEKTNGHDPMTVRMVEVLERIDLRLGETNDRLRELRTEAVATHETLKLLVTHAAQTNAKLGELATHAHATNERFDVNNERLALIHADLKKTLEERLVAVEERLAKVEAQLRSAA
jgi:predicted nuclease with TOPRIM domain